MYTAQTGLPDPEFQAEFYQDIPSKRLIAWLIDSVIVGLLTIVVLPFTAFTGLFFLPFLLAAINFIYRVVTITSGSATIGMRLVAIELRQRDGSRFDLSMAFIHTLLFTVFFSFLLPQILSIIMVMTGSKAQALHDLPLGSAAINRAARS